MKKYRAGYYFKEGFGGAFNHGFMTFASIFIIAACLLIMGCFALLAININNLIKSFEDENIILAFVDDTYTEEQSKELQPEIEALDNVDYAVFISKDEAFDSFTSKYTNSTLFEGLDSTVLRDRYAVHMKDVAYTEQTQNDLYKLEGISGVNANLTVARRFVTFRNIVAGVCIVLAVVLIVVSLFIMSNTIKLATFARREEIAIMKMVGATNGFIRWPFVLEGFVLGIVGALIAYLAQWGVYELVTERIVGSESMAFGGLISIIPFGTLAIPLLVVFLIIGFCVGVIGSSVAIRNYLRV